MPVAALERELGYESGTVKAVKSKVVTGTHSLEEPLASEESPLLALWFYLRTKILFLEKKGAALRKLLKPNFKKLINIGTFLCF